MTNLAFFKTFVALSRTQSYRATARDHTVSQSAISQQIRVLENRLGNKLIERAGKKITLTRSGEIFLKYAQNILEQYDEAKTQILQQSTMMNDVIRIATIYSIGLYRLQPVIRGFLRKYPKVNVHLEYYHNDLIYEKVINKSLDFGFVAFPKKIENVVAQYFGEDELVSAQCAQRPVFKKRVISGVELNNCRYVSLSKSTPTGREVNRSLKKLGAEPVIANEFENVETLKSAIMVGMGCAFLPLNAIERDLKDKSVEVVNVKGLQISRPLGILSHKSKVMTKAKQKFYEVFTEA